MEGKDTLKDHQNPGQIIFIKRVLFVRVRMGVGMAMFVMVPWVFGGGKYQLGMMNSLKPA
ncbi:MAG: hypothetical protein RL595_2798, partial [Planctomycetota bacterium]